MNNDRIKVLATLYMNRYHELIEKKNDVRDKWAAVGACIRKWNPGAEDFGSMFRDAMSKADFLLNHGEVNQTGGICALCEHGRTEEVREAFLDLLEKDGGEINARQGRVRDFTNKINVMLEEEFPDKWEMRQRIRTVIKYLGLIRPEENYMLRASAAAAFAGYVDFDDEIGYDKTLKLANYYRMCDDTAEYLQTRSDLLDMVGRSMKEKGQEAAEAFDFDTKLHILTYDLIDSAYRFDFYSAPVANRKSKISTVAQRKIDRMKSAAQLIDERENIVDRFDQVATVEKMARIPEMQGQKVHHVSYGDGTVSEQDGRYLMVLFPIGMKKFALPGAVVKGYLTTGGNEKELMTKCSLMDEVQVRRKKLEDELTSIDVQLQMLA